MPSRIDWESQIGRRMRLRDLYVFSTVARVGSMGKAAQELGVSQPAVSEVIADLEHALGVRLLDRTPQGVETTAHGVALDRRVLAAFDELKQGIKDIEFLSDPTVGEVRIGCPESISAAILGVDVALATNMISVGLDIGRLGLMVVQGQPKAAAEYIQATSRVGRLADKPGLVLALLNAHKPRDRLHYEGFRHFHECFYRAVEATSVTPWAARAMDRALAPVVIAAARHLIPALTPDAEAGEIAGYKSARAVVVKMILDRAPPADVVGGHAALRVAIDQLLDAWEALANDKRANAERLYYGYPRDKALLHDPLDPLLATLNPDYRRFTAGRSMRDVEHAAVLKITDPYGQPLN